MLNKMKFALAAALILGTTSAVLASNAGEDKGGGPVQTWQDIQKSAQDVQNQIKNAYHTDSARNAYGYAVPANTRPASR
jgi:hypothetical protein